MLYFGRWAPLPLNRARPWAYWAERFVLPSGFRELPARFNDTNLLVTLARARKRCRDAGFRVCATAVSANASPTGLSLFGSQHSLLLKK